MPRVKVEIESFGFQECNYLDCFIDFDRSKVEFAYTWEDVRYIYQGTERPNAPGVFDLTCAKDEGKIVLVCIPGDEQMIAKYYIPREGSGFWTIDWAE